MYTGGHWQYDNKPQESKGDGEILDKLRDSKLLKEGLLHGIKQVLTLLKLYR